MEALLKAILQIPEAEECVRLLEEGTTPVALTGLAPIHKAQLAAAMAWRMDRPLAVICADEGEAQRLAADLEILTGREALRLFARELYVRPGAVTSREFAHRRIAALCRLGAGEGRVLVVRPPGRHPGCILPHDGGPRPLRLF